MIKRTLIAFAMLWPICAVADFSDGLDAANRGDYATAYRKWLPLAEQGIAEAQYKLGGMYDYGKGVQHDDKEAVKWYRMAAIQGLAKAQLTLGVMYENGDGVARDFVQAYKWFNLAAVAGDEIASSNRDSVAGRMTSNQITEAQSLSASFRAKESAPKSVDRSPYTTTVSRETVQEIQSHLAALGYSPGPADGIPGKRTVAAVKEYQRFTGTQPDGILSSALLKILKTAVAQTPKSKKPANKEPRLVSSGSGFIVDKDYVVTNRHVISKCPNLIVYVDSRPVAGKVAASSDVDDLAVIKLAEPTPDHASFRTGRVRLGENIRVVGYPLRGVLASSLNVVSGEISALAGIGDNVRLVQMSAPVQPGNSGGPLLDDSGNVVGVVVSKLDALKIAEIIGDLPQNINFAIKGVVVKSFLDVNSIDYQTAPSDIEKRGEEIAAEARKYTVPIECYE